MCALKLPVDIKALSKIGNEVTDETGRPIAATIIVEPGLDAGLLAAAKANLRPQSDQVTLKVRSTNECHPVLDTGSNHAVQQTGEMADDDSRDDKAVLQIAFIKTPTLALCFLQQPSPCKRVLISQKPRSLREYATARGIELDLDNIIACDMNLDAGVRYTEVFEQLGAWIAANMREERLAFARTFAFIRRPCALELARSAALRNGAIGAIFLIPGADMPLITFNQAKMMLEIASMFGLELGGERIKEVLVLIAGAFGCRGVARFLTSRIPVFGWAIRGAIGYSATIALAEAALKYYGSLTDE
jgi:uncharacterized protein (DUF697 family)